jgi:hypothetical protein
VKIPIACSLSADDMGDRLEEWRATVALATAREPTPDGYRLRFASDPAFAGRLAELAAREVACCAFFTFAVTVATDGLALDVSVPADARPLLDDLFGPAPAA